MNWLQRLLSPTRAIPEVPALALLEPEFMRRLERLRLAALRALGGGLREGHRLGAYRGGQLEFHGHRDYSPGDELRYLDWNSYARLGKPYIKEFAREESGFLHVLLDVSASMNLGAPTKFDFARKVAALFAHVALSSRDRVALHPFGGAAAEPSFPRTRSRTNTVDYLTFLNALSPAPSNATEVTPVSDPLRVCVERFLKSGAQRGGVIVLSDFWTELSVIEDSLARLARAGFDVSVVQILAAEELEPVSNGWLRLTELESDEPLELWCGAEQIQSYLQELERHSRALEQALRRHSGRYLCARSDMALESALLSILRQKRWVV